MMIHCLIVDDEPLAGQLIEDYITKIPSLHLIQRCNHPLLALDIIQTEHIDLLFLDIQMPDISGLDLLKTIPDPPLVILTTAFSEYALDSYLFNVVDYLLKPVPFDRFLLAVNKAIERLSNQYPENDESAKKIPPKEYLFIRSGYKMVRIDYHDILFIEAMGEYVAVYTPIQKHLKSDSMKNLEQALPAGRFIRVHKSYLVAIDKVKAFYGNTLEIGNHTIPVGRTYKESVTAVFS